MHTIDNKWLIIVWCLRSSEKIILTDLFEMVLFKTGHLGNSWFLSLNKAYLYKLLDILQLYLTDIYFHI